MDRATDAYLAGQLKTKPARQKEAAHYSAATWLAELSQHLDDGQTISPRSKKAVTERLVHFIHNPAIGKYALKTSFAYLQTTPDQQAFFQDAVAACLSRRVFPAVGPLCQMATLLITADNSFAPKVCQGLGRILSVSLSTAYQTENKYRIEAAGTLLQCAPELAEAFSSAALGTLGKRRTQPSFSPIRTLELHLPEITERAPVCILFIAERLLTALASQDPCIVEDATRLIHKMAPQGPRCAAEIGRLLVNKDYPIPTQILPQVLAALILAPAEPAVQTALESKFLGYLSAPHTPEGLTALEATPLFLSHAPHTLPTVWPRLTHALNASTPEANAHARKAISRLVLEAPTIADACALKLIDSIQQSATPHIAEVDALIGLLKGPQRQPDPISDALYNIMDKTAHHTSPEVQAAACRLITVRHIPHTMRHARRAVHHLSALIASPHANVSHAALEAIPSLCVPLKKPAHIPLLHDLLQPTFQHLTAGTHAPHTVEAALKALSGVFMRLSDKPRTPKQPPTPQPTSRRLHIIELLK